MLRTYLDRVAARTHLTGDEMRAAIATIIGTDCPPGQIAGLLMALRTKGETADELAGASRALRQHAVAVPLERPCDLDTAGTGGDGKGTLNLSTAAAIVAAAAGLRVAKHGNRAISSRCGSSDLLAALGIATDLSPTEAAHDIATTGFAFLFAPNYHPATRAVAAVRRDLGVRTMFNLLGPLSNPAKVRTQLVGAHDQRAATLMAGALQRLGIERALVVSADVGLDEISPEGATTVHDVAAAGVRTYRLTPADFGLAEQPLASIRGGDPQTNARALGAVLAGEDHPARTAVVLNAGAALVVAGAAATFREGAMRAGALIDSGAVRATMARLATGRRTAA